MGGSFIQKLHISGKGGYTIAGKYDDIIEPEKIEFREQGQQTKVVLTQEGFPDPTLGKIVSEGTSESFEKLAELLASPVASAD